MAKKFNPHKLFWQLLKELPGYEEEYKDVIKEGLVNEYSAGKTCSLSEMYKKYPTAYTKMIDYMKGDSWAKQQRYDKERDQAAKRVIAVICQWVDKMGYKLESDEKKIDYAKAIAIRASSCSDFNKIPLSKLRAIYSLYSKQLKVNPSPVPHLELPISLN